MAMAWKVSDGVTLDAIVRCAREHIGQDWPTLARGFKMSKTEIDAIKSDNRDNLVEQIVQFFTCWERQNGEAATAQAFVDCVMKELPHSDVIFHLKKKRYIEKKGVGGSSMTSSPTQLQSLVPIQESSPLASLIPIPESSPKGAKPILYGLHETGIDGDDVELDFVPESDNVPGKLHAGRDCVDERAEDDRRTMKIKNLMRMWHNKTGEGPFDKDHVILTDNVYGLVKCVFLVDEDKALKAGIELENAVPSGGNGIYEGKRYFKCDKGCSLFVPYNTLRADNRFEDNQDEPEASDQRVDIKNMESPKVFGMASENVLSSPTEGSLCKLAYCTRPKFTDMAGKVYDYCGKYHAKADSQLKHTDPDSLSTSPLGSTCVRFVIPQDCTGLVIGKGGKNISKVESATNTSIKILSNISVGGKTEGIIIGSHENCTRAAIDIMECIKEKRAMHTATTKKITMPNSVVGRVIGKGGDTINYIKAETEVQDIEFDKPPKGVEAVDPNYIRTCSITGSDEQIEGAIKLIRQAQGEDIVTSARLAAVFERFGFQIKDDSETVHTPSSADQCAIS